ncbi:MAG TPA: hypothetical protein VNI54_11240 [Thermoanaerobaculia bacterium]|nr:hypothetical protein [Thermoanaerobaculia bacterium]
MPRILRIAITALAAMSAIYAAVDVWRQNEEAAGLDFYIYFVAAQLAGRADVENIYGAEVQERVGEEYFERAQRSGSALRKYDAGRRRRLDLVSSPFLFSTLRWVSRDYDRALTQYHALVLACFIGGVLLMCRTVGVPWWAALFLLAGLLLWYRGFEADLRVGNVNSIQLLAVAIAVRFARIRWIVFGLLIASKPNLLFVPLLFLIAERHRWRANLLQGAIGGAIAFVVASISYGSPRVWLQWVSAANAFYHRLPTRMERNVTPALALFQEYGEWISYAIAAVLLALVIVRMKRHDAPLLAGLGILVYLLSANVVWLHYMVLVIPIAVALLRWKATAVVAIAALLLIAEEPYEWIARRAAADVEVWLIAPAIAALFACGVWKLSHRDEAAAAR